MEADPLIRGKMVAAVLAGAWRCSPPPLSVSPEALDSIAPLLAASGAGGLTWYRLRGMESLNSATRRELRQHYRLQTLQAVARESAVATLFGRLRAAGVEPLLIKGWSSARLYPEPGLRPSADIDLCIEPDKVAAATTALIGKALPCAVDLHVGVPDLADRSWTTVFRRSRLVALGDMPVRILGPEDQLRLLCLHLTRHGIARPLWLCDIAACLELAPEDFAWDYCLSGAKHLTSWMTCVLGLASQLLAAQTQRLWIVPGWVERSVLWCWGIRTNYGAMAIKSALHLGLGPVPWMPSLLVQVAAFVRRKVPHVLHRLIRPRKHHRLPFTIHHH